MCQSGLTKFFLQNSPSLPQNSVRLSEFSPTKQYSGNSIPPVSYSSVPNNMRPVEVRYVHIASLKSHPTHPPLGSHNSGRILVGLIRPLLNRESESLFHPQPPSLLIFHLILAETGIFPEDAIHKAREKKDIPHFFEG